MNLESQIRNIAKRAKGVVSVASQLSTEKKNALLRTMAQSLLTSKEPIHQANAKDLEGGKKKGLSKALLDRLTLTDDRIQQMAEGLEEVAALPDPVGQITRSWDRPNGLHVQKTRIPLGVILMIYESRPNVTVDAAGLCLKAGNVVVLRGGSEAIHSNRILTKILREACEEKDISPDIIQIVSTTKRQALKWLVQQNKYIDLAIPRGGEGLMKWMGDHSKIPFVKHDKGTCHVYVDDEALLEMAIDISFNSKVQRPGVCNAMETLLVHEKIAPKFLPPWAKNSKKPGVPPRDFPKTS